MFFERIKIWLKFNVVSHNDKFLLTLNFNFLSFFLISAHEPSAMTEYVALSAEIKVGEEIICTLAKCETLIKVSHYNSCFESLLTFISSARNGDVELVLPNNKRLSSTLFDFNIFLAWSPQKWNKVDAMRSFEFCSLLRLSGLNANDGIKIFQQWKLFSGKIFLCFFSK